MASVAVVLTVSFAAWVEGNGEEEVLRDKLRDAQVKLAELQDEADDEPVEPEPQRPDPDRYADLWEGGPVRPGPLLSIPLLGTLEMELSGRRGSILLIQTRWGYSARLLRNEPRSLVNEHYPLRRPHQVAAGATRR